MDLRDKTALVTGGAVRIGRTICRALADCGCKVIVHYRRSVDDAEDLRRELESVEGVEAYAVAADLNSEEACKRLIDEAAECTGSIDILVNNAAVFNADDLSNTTIEKLQAEYWPNLFAPILLTREFAERCQRGKVVNILDRRVVGLDIERIPYVLTKKSLADFTQLAALDLAPGITVNAVAPGAILPPPGEGEDYMAAHAAPVPLERRVSPGDIAGAVLFLLCHDAITGQIIYVDGGQHLLGTVKP